MAKKSIIWTDTAIKQRRQILKYWTIRNKSSTYAEKLIYLIRNRVELIADNPLAGKATNHTDTRESALGNFSIYYKFINDRIYIVAFWDNRQNPKTLIEIFKS
ncbi:MAG TPA: type II toxin-antitoxin system RelE/ParE family toxin [Chitinophagales bacterium]|nr:type II toxin-antitoxin system RelE/ParE family toxin [Chitinophagales bacterium]